MKPGVCVRVVLRDKEGRMLFLKRANSKHENGKWSLPGGKIEFLQRVEEACIKEIKEETNLDITDTKFLFYTDEPPISEMHWIELYFTADFSGYVKINEESSDFKWIDLGELNKFEIAFNQDKSLNKFLKN